LDVANATSLNRAKRRAGDVRTTKALDSQDASSVSVTDRLAALDRVAAAKHAQKAWHTMEVGQNATVASKGGQGPLAHVNDALGDPLALAAGHDNDMQQGAVGTWPLYGHYGYCSGGYLHGDPAGTLATCQEWCANKKECQFYCHGTGNSQWDCLQYGECPSLESTFYSEDMTSYSCFKKPDNFCPESCASPNCQAGSPQNGGTAMAGANCANHCSPMMQGIRYCGTGDSYTSLGSVDCSACDPATILANEQARENNGVPPTPPPPITPAPQEAVEPAALRPVLGGETGRGPKFSWYNPFTWMPKIMHEGGAFGWIVYVIAVLMVAYIYHTRERLEKAPMVPYEGEDFTHGFCDILRMDEWQLICFTCWCPGIRWSETLSDNKIALLGFWCALLIFIILSLPFFWILLTCVGVYYRQKLRHLFGHGSMTARTLALDALAWFCCPCCAILQEAREVDDCQLKRYAGSPMMSYQHPTGQVRTGPPPSMNYPTNAPVPQTNQSSPYAAGYPYGSRPAQTLPPPSTLGPSAGPPRSQYGGPPPPPAHSQSQLGPGGRPWGSMSPAGAPPPGSQARAIDTRLARDA
jgi:Cys-rich protein (TIGR01571 family)